MEKELKIQIPDGYEVDTKKSSFERIVFKQKTDKTKEMSDFLFDMLNESTCKIHGEKEVTYYKNNEWVFQQDFKNERLWIRYGLIWKIFEEKYSLNYNQIRDFIASWIETNTGWRGLTPSLVCYRDGS